MADGPHGAVDDVAGAGLRPLAVDVPERDGTRREQRHRFRALRDGAGHRRCSVHSATVHSATVHSATVHSDDRGSGGGGDGDGVVVKQTSPPPHRDQPREPREEARSGGGEQIRGRAGGGDAAVLDDDDVIGERGDVDRIVGDQQRRAAAQTAPQHPAQIGGGGGVKCGEGLVEQDRADVGRQCPGQRHPRRLTAGQGRGTPVGQMRRTHRRQLAARAIPVTAGELDVAQRRAMGQQRRVLRQQHRARHVAGHGRAAAHRQPRDRAQQRRLARAVGADHRGRPPRGDRRLRIEQPRHRHGQVQVTARARLLCDDCLTVVARVVDGGGGIGVGGSVMSRGKPGAVPAAQPPRHGGADGDQRDGDAQQHRRQRQREVGIVLALQVDGQRQGAGDSRQRPGERQRRAEFAEGAGQ